MTTLSRINDSLNQYNLTGENRAAGMVLLAATQVGADAPLISQFTGIALDTVTAFEERLRANRIWVGEETHENWNQDPVEFLCHILVARGEIQTQYTALS